MNERLCKGDGQMQALHMEALDNACMDYGNFGLEKLTAWSTQNDGIYIYIYIMLSKSKARLSLWDNILR